MTKHDHSISAIHTLVGVLRDGEKGFREVGARMQQPEHRLFYLEESHVRSSFAAELERVLTSLTGAPVQETGTLLGYVHRLYADLRAALATGDYTLLDTTEVCERIVVHLYNKALLEKEMPDRFLGILAYQAGHVRRVYDLIVEYRAQAMTELRAQPPSRSSTESPDGTAS